MTVNDGGPAHKTDRRIDITRGGWKALGYNRPGLTDVDVEILSLGKGRRYTGHKKHTTLSKLGVN
jgi:rare lipoprotein A (peptidoglycan hydrolase)